MISVSMCVCLPVCVRVFVSRLGGREREKCVYCVCVYCKCLSVYCGRTAPLLLSNTLLLLSSDAGIKKALRAAGNCSQADLNERFDRVREKERNQNRHD